MISSTSADFRRAVQRLISSSITALIDVSFARLHLSRFSLGHYMDIEKIAKAIEADAGQPLPELRRALGEAQGRCPELCSEGAARVHGRARPTNGTDRGYARSNLIR